VRLVLVDLKRIEFVPYANLPHLDRPLITNPSEVLPLLKDIWAEVERRLALIRSSGANNIKKFNHMRADKLPYMIAIFDELAVIMLDKTIKGKAEVESYFARIASVGRAAGVHLILSTQRPEKAVITKLISANFSGRIALACSSVYDSMTIIGNGAACFAEEDTPPGRAILAYGRHRRPLQIAMLTDAQRASIVDDANAGRIGQKKMYHDVTVQELAQYALDNLNGVFHTNKLFAQFESRGIVREEIRTMAARYRVEEFTIGDDVYRLTQSHRRGPLRICAQLPDAGCQEIESEDT
jgi:DNA segregation ATPase FtsK/SpoIIIE-like protein